MHIQALRDFRFLRSHRVRHLRELRWMFGCLSLKIAFKTIAGLVLFSPWLLLGIIFQLLAYATEWLAERFLLPLDWWSEITGRNDDLDRRIDLSQRVRSALQREPYWRPLKTKD